MLTSEHGWRAAILAVAVTGACSSRTIVAVDPYPPPPPCADAGTAGCMPPAPGLLDGLIGYWRLDDATGSLIAHDSSSFGNHGTLVGIDGLTGWIAGGPEGRTLAIPGSGYISVAPSTSIDSITDRVTIAAWMYIDGT
ncbi:MAG TPA: hypothetical protein VHU40_08655, partial [Polyangia bacterium]|nr:hypothetical protein [Polyangia bacterium]